MIAADLKAVAKLQTTFGFSCREVPGAYRLHCPRVLRDQLGTEGCLPDPAFLTKLRYSPSTGAVSLVTVSKSSSHGHGQHEHNSVF